MRFPSVSAATPRSDLRHGVGARGELRLHAPGVQKDGEGQVVSGQALARTPRAPMGTVLPGPGPRVVQRPGQEQAQCGRPAVSGPGSALAGGPRVGVAGVQGAEAIWAQAGDGVREDWGLASFRELEILKTVRLF